MHFVVGVRFPNTKQYTRPTGFCPLYYYTPGCHRRNCFSCFLVPDIQFLPWFYLKPPMYSPLEHPVEDLEGLAMGHATPLSPRPSFFSPLLCPSCSGDQFITRTCCLPWYHSSLSIKPLKHCQVSVWSPKKHIPQTAKRAVSAQDSVIWYQQPTLKSRADTQFLKPFKLQVPWYQAYNQKVVLKE